MRGYRRSTTDKYDGSPPPLPKFLRGRPPINFHVEPPMVRGLRELLRVDAALVVWTGRSVHVLGMGRAQNERAGPGRTGPGRNVYARLVDN